MLTRGADGGQAEWKKSAVVEAFQKENGALSALWRAASCACATEDANPRGFVQQMTAYVDAHYADESLSLQYLADHVVYMNADYIGREFTRAMGQKFSAYLLAVRMERAKQPDGGRFPAA